MLHFLANPGVFHHSPVDCSPLLLLLAMAILPFALIIRLQNDRSWAKKWNSVIAFWVLLAVTIISLTSCGLYVNYTIKQIEQREAKYDSSVINWLNSSYGIKINADVAQRLVHGETFAITYHSKEIVVSIIETTDKKLSIVDANHTVLKPKN